MTNEHTDAIEYPSEIHRLLKLGGSSGAESTQHFVLPGVDLPHTSHAAAPASVETHETHVDVLAAKPKSWKNFVIYPFVFIAAFFFFYVLFNFSALFAQVQSWFTRPQTEVVLGEELSSYYIWIQGYYFTVNDTKLLDPHNDIDKDGLSNLDEFSMKTNPTLADSDTDGFSDGIEFINNMNLWGDGRMPQQQRKLAEKLDSILINNRIGYNTSQNSPAVGGVVSGQSTINYDLGKPGKLSIPRLNVQVPLVWSQDPLDFDADLTRGVIHYPGTAMPGEEGMVYVSGHSSDYLWKRNPYGNVFSTLNRLQAGDDIFIELYGPDGKVYHYRYTVTHQRVYAADDQTQFIDNSGKKLNLSTCWPIGTQKDRLVVTAVEKSL